MTNATIHLIVLIIILILGSTLIVLIEMYATKVEKIYRLKETIEDLRNELNKQNT